MKKLSILISLFISCSLNASMLAMDSAQETLDTMQKACFLFDDKTRGMERDITVGTGWYDARLITPGTQYYLKRTNDFTLYMQEGESHEQHLFKETPTQTDVQSPSHGLLRADDRSVAISVDTSIRTPTNRKKEKKSTHVQYDWHDIQQNNNDFVVDPCELDRNDAVVLNRWGNPLTNYDGGHLVDHKFSAQGSHVDNTNYVPQHHYYNRWLKEYIVKSADGYLEIPLFTNNPPVIKVKDEDRYDPIPVGILLVPLRQYQILDMYYFPNNQFNYRKCQFNLGIAKKGMAQNMIANFRIRREFHKLLLPAIIYEVRDKYTDLAQQLIHESKGKGVIGELIEGMSFLNLDDEQAALATLASDVIHQGNVKITNILGISSAALATMNLGQQNQGALFQSFNVLGQYLVEYAMKNALKSELISTHSRIMFANIITDFITDDEDVSEQALDRVDESYKEIYPVALQELWDIREHMNIRDLLYFTNLYQSLASHQNHIAYDTGYEIWEDMDYDYNVAKYIKLLELLYNRTAQFNLEIPQMRNLVFLFSEAQRSLSYLVTLNPQEESLATPRAFLKASRDRVLEWEQLSSENYGSYDYSPDILPHFMGVKSYDDSPNSITYFRGLNGTSIHFLGTNSSVTYTNDEDDDSQEDGDDTESEG